MPLIMLAQSGQAYLFVALSYDVSAGGTINFCDYFNKKTAQFEQFPDSFLLSTVSKEKVTKISLIMLSSFGIIVLNSRKKKKSICTATILKINYRCLNSRQQLLFGLVYRFEIWFKCSP